MTKLSPSEERLLNLLPRSGEPVTTEELAERYWEGRKRPYNNRIIITNLARALVKKTANTRPRVSKSKPIGPHPTEVWIGKRKSRAGVTAS